MAMITANGQDFNECLQKDSISCLQNTLYRTAKEFFNKEKIDIVNGVSMVKKDDRSSRSGKEVLYDQEIDAANSVIDRQSALENFIGDEAGSFLSGRTLRINFAPAMEKIGQTARAMVDSVPTEVREAVNDVVEGRGKKKLLKSIWPLLLAAKAKMSVLAVLMTFGIALLAKKAIVASLLSLAISGFIGLRSMWSKACGYTATPYNSGWNNAASGSGSIGWSAPVQSAAGWSSGGSVGGWDDGQSSYASGQSQAFSGYH
ncbi:hypothetical protein PV327_001103 [Microctonus hyperodae]|uniref:Osiris 6 n=1 Tax=Microctonus hyperodae TaxID=165561 RepID=A0AA39L2V5_MICHY|nr:hypothetical protein PV327_001103 [Microctonus hyperodae]